MKHSACFILGGLLALVPFGLAQATTLDFAPPGLDPYTGQDIGDVQIGAEITALSAFTIDSAGIKFNPFGNVTAQPKTYELDAFILL